MCGILLWWSLVDSNTGGSKRLQRCTERHLLQNDVFMSTHLGFFIWNSEESRNFHLFPSGQYVMKLFFSCLASFMRTWMCWVFCRSFRMALGSSKLLSKHWTQLVKRLLRSHQQQMPRCWRNNWKVWIPGGRRSADSW